MVSPALNLFVGTFFVLWGSGVIGYTGRHSFKVTHDHLVYKPFAQKTSIMLPPAELKKIEMFPLSIHCVGDRETLKIDFSDAAYGGIRRTKDVLKSLAHERGIALHESQ